MKNEKTFEISTWSIMKFFLFIIGLFFLYYIKNVVALIFIVIILVAGFTPFVNWLVSLKVPRVLAVVILYLLILLIMSLFVYIIIPPLSEQISNVSNNLTFYSQKINALNINYSQLFFEGKDFLTVIGNSLSNVSGGVVKTATSIFGGVASALTVLVLTFYILVEQDSIEKFILAFVPKTKHKHSLHIYNQISFKLGSWLQGQLSLAFIIGISAYVILSILGIKYALMLAVIAGILEIVPIIGPILSGVIAVSIAYLTGAQWWQIISIAISYTAVQQIESQFLVPKMMGKAVGLSPIIIIIALMIGGEIGGILGAILAIPIAAGISVLIQEFSINKKIDID